MFHSLALQMSIGVKQRVAVIRGHSAARVRAKMPGRTEVEAPCESGAES